MNTNILNAISVGTSSNYKSDVKTSKDNNVFGDVLANVSTVKQNSEPLNKSDNSKNTKDSKFEISDETKSALKDAGLSDKEIENIKSPDDLKNVIAEKILNKDSDGKVDMSKLLLVLASFLNMDTKNLQNLKENTISQLKDTLNSLVKEVSNEGKNITGEKLSQTITSAGDKFKEILNENLSKVEDPLVRSLLTKEVMTKVEKEILPQITESLSKANSSVSSQDLMSKIQQELKGALNESLKDTNVNKNSKNNNLDSKEMQGEILNNKNTFEVAVTSKEQSSDKNSSSKKETSKDDNFLKSLTGDGSKDDKISKASNFMTQFNNVNKNVTVENVGDIVINKTTIGNDVIKTIKYMETNNIKNLTVKIAPKELGEVIIKLTMEGGVMKASIGTSNKEAFNLLNSNLSDMTSKIQNNDTKVNSLSLNIYNEDTTFFKDGSNNGSNENSKKHKKAKAIDIVGETTNEIDNASEIDSNLNILA